MPARRPFLELILAVLAGGLVLWAVVTWLASVLLAMALLSAWLLVVVLALRGQPHQNLAVSALAVVASLGLLELASQTGVLTSGALRGHSADRGRIETTEPWILTPDPELAYRLSGPAHAHSIVRRDGVVIYDVHYTIDAAGHRVTPGNATGDRLVMVMGDSFHFGEGLDDGDTMPAHLVRQSQGNLRPVNLAVPGYGPHQVLRQLQLGRLPAGRFDHLLLSVLDDHVLRASGYVEWLLDSPRYDLVDGRLVLAGTFRPSSRFIDRFLAGSAGAALVQQAMARLEPSSELRLAAILGEIRREARARHGAEVLILYHASVDAEGNPGGDGRRVRALICRAGVPYIDVSKHLGITRADRSLFYIPGDGHPTSEMNARVARLVVDYVDGRTPADRCDD